MSEYANWLASLTPEEMRAYKRGFQEGREHTRQLTRTLISYRICLGRIAKGTYTDPAHIINQAQRALEMNGERA